MSVSLRLGTRGSALARWQADWVAARLREFGNEVELVHIKTTGDVTSGSLSTGGGQGLFTKEIQRALLDERVDLAVHSLKDLPTEPVPGLSLAVVPLRAPTGDCLVTGNSWDVDALPEGAVIGTGSVRRQAQLLHIRPDLKMHDIRGNVDTRLGKLAAGDYDAIILAEAGLRRLDLDAHVEHVIPRDVMLPAVGQGALGIETREQDEATRAAVAALDHPESHAAVLAERALLAELRGGCLAPVGALAEVRSGQLLLEATVLSRDGSQRLLVSSAGEMSGAAEQGKALARELLNAGAAELIRESRDE